MSELGDRLGFYIGMCTINEVVAINTKWEFYINSYTDELGMFYVLSGHSL